MGSGISSEKISEKINIRRASPEEFSQVMDIYDDIIEKTKNSENSPKWTRNVYPTDEMVMDDIRKGALYVAALKEAGEGPAIVASMVLDHEYNEGYDDVKWLIDASPSEVMYIHLLGVRPEYMRRGIARELVKFAAQEARKQGAPSIRLDVILGNKKAEALYTGQGFKYVDTCELYYEDTGRISFKVFELVI